MPRVKRGVKARRRRKKTMKLAKGNVGGRGRQYRQARETVEKGLCYAYRDRRVHKRNMRSLWIIRIGAAAKNNGIPYNRFIHGLKEAGIDLDRKVLAELATRDPAAFLELVEIARAA